MVIDEMKTNSVNWRVLSPLTLNNETPSMNSANTNKNFPINVTFINLNIICTERRNLNCIITISNRKIYKEQ